jgi:hypothetical protein
LVDDFHFALLVNWVTGVVVNYNTKSKAVNRRLAISQHD